MTGSHPIDGRNFPIFFLNGSGISEICEVHTIRRHFTPQAPLNHSGVRLCDLMLVKC